MRTTLDKIKKYQKFYISHILMGNIPSFPTHGYQTEFLMKFDEFREIILNNYKIKLSEHFRDYIDDFENARHFGYYLITFYSYFSDDCAVNYLTKNNELRKTKDMLILKNMDIIINNDDLLIDVKTFKKYFNMLYGRYNMQFKSGVYNLLMYIIKNIDINQLSIYYKGIK